MKKRDTIQGFDAQSIERVVIYVLNVFGARERLDSFTINLPITYVHHTKHKVIN